MAKKKSKSAYKKAQVARHKVQQKRVAAPVSKFPLSKLWITQGPDGSTIHHGWHIAAIFLIAFVVYALTMPTVITYEDAGIFNLMCSYGQAAHPPGYPLFSILCFPFSHIPFIPPVIAGNVLSAIFAGMACAVLYLITVNVVRGEYYYGYLAALGLAFSKLFWSQSIIQEVYTLHAFLILFLFLTTFIYARDLNPNALKWIALGVGLAIANHWPLTVLAGPAIVILLLPVWKNFIRQVFQGKMFFKLLAIFLVSGPLLYLYILTSNLPSPITFYEPVSTLDKFLTYVTRGTYSALDNQTISWFDKLNFSKFLLQEAFIQFGAAFVPFIAAGFYWQWRRWHWAICLSLTYLYISSTFLLLLLLNFKYTELFEGVFNVYQVAAYPGFALWAALALKEVMEWFDRKMSERQNYIRIVGSSLTLLLISSTVWANWNYNQRSDSRLAQVHARTVLNTLDKDSVFLTYGDVDIPIIQQYVQDKVRKDDVTLYNAKGQFLSNRYYHRIIGSDLRGQLAAAFVKSIKDKPVYYSQDFYFDHGSGVENFGVYQKIRKDLPAGTVRYTWLPEMIDLWNELPIKGGDIKFDATIKRNLRRALTLVMIHNNNNDPEVQAALDERLKNGSFYEILGLVKYLLDRNDLQDYEKRFGTLTSLVQKLGQRVPKDIRPKDLAILRHAQAVAQHMNSPIRGNESIPALTANLRKALDVYTSEDNQVARKLLVLYAATSNAEAFKELYRSYPGITTGNRIVESYARRLSLSNKN